MKSSSPPTAKGDRVSHTDVSSGNPYRNGGGQFGGQPGGPDGGAAKKDYKNAMQSLEECSTGPAVGPEGPGHTHEIQCPPEAGVTAKPLPPTLNPQTMLTMPQQAQPEPQDMATLTDSSAHLQNQESGYLDALRMWQQLYG